MGKAALANHDAVKAVAQTKFRCPACNGSGCSPRGKPCYRCKGNGEVDHLHQGRPKKQPPNHDAVKAAAQALLTQGLATNAEISALSGRSRQIIHHWAKELGADTARQDHLAKLWDKTMRQHE